MFGSERRLLDGQVLEYETEKSVQVARPESSKSVASQVEMQQPRPSKTLGVPPDASSPSPRFAERGPGGGEQNPNIVSLLKNFYRTDPDAGVHSARVGSCINSGSKRKSSKSTNNWPRKVFETIAIGM